jgi:hypothetical protein
LAAFRIGFGALLLVAALRYFFNGWIAEYFLTPAHFFKYWGFSWVKPWPGSFMYLHFGLMTACALGVLLGYRYRASSIGYGLLFGYAHLIDKTNYLNHYYLVVCLCGLMACLPLHATWSLDARRDARVRQSRVPAWTLWALRAQFALVYCFGGIAKLNADWLLRAQPLSVWLARSADLPVLGGPLTQPWAAYAMSWAGALFDLSIVPLLLWRRSRAWALVAVVTFHALTAYLFNVGMFPYFMLSGSLLFLAPSWPCRALSRLGVTGFGAAEPVSAPPRPGMGAWTLPVFGLYFAVQLALPLRHWLYPGQECWTEQGFRFSWNVMLMEKNGAVDFRVVEPSSGRIFHASPAAYFTPYQVAMMAPQPDMLLEAARIVAADYRARGVVMPAVYVDAFASLNGRPMQRLVDPNVDLAREVDGLANKSWILPLQPQTETLLTAASFSRNFE